MGLTAEPVMDGKMHRHLRFIVEDAGLPVFFPLLQQGVVVSARVGCSIKDFLYKEMRVGPGTLEKIQSVFLDGRPVDNLDAAKIRDGSVLALSAAMPGLVGATLRRGGAYASFRSTITHDNTGSRCVTGEGFVRIKLFNLLMEEMGPGLLLRGILITSSDVAAFLKGLPPDSWKAFSQVLLDGKPVGKELATDAVWMSHQERICLSVITRPE